MGEVKELYYLRELLETRRYNVMRIAVKYWKSKAKINKRR